MASPQGNRKVRNRQEVFQGMGTSISMGAPARPPVKAVITPEKKAKKENTTEVWDLDKSCPAEDWSPRATTADQFLNPKYRDTCKAGPLTVQVFDLSNSEQLKEYNTMLSERLPEGAPHVFIEETTKKYSRTTDNWKIMVSFYRVMYLKLIKRPATPDDDEEEEDSAAAKEPQPKTPESK